MLSTRFQRAVVGEMLMVVRASGQPPGLGSIPLTVLSAARQAPRIGPTWAQMQDELAALSTDSEHITAPEAGHYIHLDEPDLVIKAIRDLVRRCR
jgi:pimeloyl-ACP methyl ester carboxylesterase